MKLMFSKDGGFHNFPDGGVEDALKNGWVDGTPLWNAAVEAKRTKPQNVTKPVELVTLSPQVEVKRTPGRPRKAVPSILNDGDE